jgi:thiosulfate/3-mercaptopyruvate sulfurtransferase
MNDDQCPIVTAEWLHSCLNDRANQDLVIVDCRFALTDPNLGQQQYQTAHLPGSHYLDLNRDLSNPVGEHGGRHPLPDPANLGEKLALIGVNAHTLVIALSLIHI